MQKTPPASKLYAPSGSSSALKLCIRPSTPLALLHVLELNHNAKKKNPIAQGLEAAFERGEVSSWVDFFRRGAVTPVYHDRFPKLSEELRDALANGDETAANLLSMLNKVHRSRLGCCWAGARCALDAGRGPKLPSPPVEIGVVAWFSPLSPVACLQAGVGVPPGVKNVSWRANTGRSCVRAQAGGSR